MSNKAKPTCKKCEKKMTALYIHKDGDYVRAKNVYECVDCDIMVKRDGDKLLYLDELPSTKTNKKVSRKPNNDNNIQNENMVEATEAEIKTDTQVSSLSPE